MVKISKLVDMGVKAFADDGAKLSTKKAAFEAITKKSGSAKNTKWLIKHGDNPYVSSLMNQTENLLEKQYNKGLVTGAAIGVSITAIPFGYSLYKLDKTNEQSDELYGDYISKLDEAVEILEGQEAKIKQLEKELKAKEEAENLYTVKEGDCFWNIAKAQLIEENKDKKDYKPTNAEIKELAEEIMALNNYKYDKNNFNSEPPLYPGDKLKLTA